MIAVALNCAVVAFSAWRSVERANEKVRLDQRRAAFETLAVFHGAKTRWASIECDKTHCTFRNGDGDALTAEFKQYHFNLAAKYRRAARSPWLPVPPDPPEPK
jgi:hypothetical protein